jgi:glycosyltransferase involved in cell wall biosynthesis
MKMPAVSVLIPTYNYDGYLPEAIDPVHVALSESFELE